MRNINLHFTPVVRSTGYIPGNKRPQGYPETLISRVPVERTVVTKLVGRLREVNKKTERNNFSNLLGVQKCSFLGVIFLSLLFS